MDIGGKNSVFMSSTYAFDEIQKAELHQEALGRVNLEGHGPIRSPTIGT
jgi:hypothetical protein